MVCEKWYNEVKVAGNFKLFKCVNRKKKFRGFFQFSIVRVLNISPLWKPEI